jgi:hypothetical protein
MVSAEKPLSLSFLFLSLFYSLPPLSFTLTLNQFVIVSALFLYFEKPEKRKKATKPWTNVGQSWIR